MHEQVRRAARALEKVPVGSAPEVVFDALRPCAPVVGGLIGVMKPEATGSVISHVVGLPGDVLEAWANTPLAHLHRMMAPLLSAQPGELISDRMAITGPFREQLTLLEVLGSAGLGESAGYKVAAGRQPDGRSEHRFLTFALDSSESFSPAQREMFRLLHPVLAATLTRIALPILPHQPLFAQFVEERHMGFLCLSTSLGIVELNDRAHELAQQCLRSARVAAGRGWLARLAERAMIETSGGRSWCLERQDNRARVEIEVIPLDRHAHPSSQALPSNGDLIVLTVRERCLPERGLSPRQQQVANLLINTGLSYKEIAAELGIAEGTVRKHVEKVYRAYGVQSRPELMSLPR